MTSDRYRRQWLARGGNSFMPFDQYVAPRLARRQRRRPGQAPYMKFRDAVCRECPAWSASRCQVLAATNIRQCHRSRPTAFCPHPDGPRWGPAI